MYFVQLQALKKFIKNVNDSAEASSILLNWNLKLAPESIQLAGRHLNPENLVLVGSNGPCWSLLDVDLEQVGSSVIMNLQHWSILVAMVLAGRGLDML